MPLVPPVWVLILCLLATGGAAIAQEVFMSGLRGRLKARARQDGRQYFAEMDNDLSLRLAAAMPQAGLPIGAAAVTGRHVVIDPEPESGTAPRSGVCRADFVVGSVRLRSNRSRVVAFRMDSQTLEILHVAAASGPLLGQFEEALETLPPGVAETAPSAAPTAG